MNIINPLKMNDWSIKEFSIVILSIQIAILGLVGLDILNIYIPVIRQVLAFIYLTFVPGIIFLRILKIHKIGNVKTVLYSVGLSITILMFTIFFINIIYPMIGISQPISLLSLVITLSLVVLLLLAICYMRDKDFKSPDYINSENINLRILFLCLIPFISIFGTYLFNQTGFNALQLSFLIIISIFPLISIKWVPEKFYPLIIFIVSLSLLYHTSLVSNYMWGSDIQQEYYLSNLTILSSYWNLNIPENVNAMLSVVILAPIYSIILKLDLIEVLKVIYPFLFAMVPLGLFKVFQMQTNSKIAMLSIYYFIFIGSFFAALPSLARQEIAEIFLVLLMLSLFDKNLNNANKSVFLILFGISMIVSHYGLSYIFIFMIITITILSLIYTKFIDKTNYRSILTNNYSLLFIVFALAWFMYVSGSSIFDIGITIGNNIINSLTDMFDPTSTQGLYVIKNSLPVFQSIERYLYLITQFFIGIGLLTILVTKKYNLNMEFKLFSIASFLIAIACIIIPNFASTMNTDRMFHFALFFLAPLFIIGILTIFKFFSKILRGKYSVGSTEKKSFYMISIFLIIFFMFSSSFIYQIFDQEKVGRFALDSNVDFYWVNTEELSGINWLADNYKPAIIYTDCYKLSMFNSKIPNDTRGIIKNSMPNVDKSYLFLSNYDIKTHELLAFVDKNNLDYIKYPNYGDFMQKIYDSGGSNILSGSSI